MDTAETKRVLFEAMHHPTKKRMANLAEHVISLCDAVDSRESYGEIIRAGDESLQTSFSMLNELMKKI